jgi:hypothetical protein
MSDLIKDVNLLRFYYSSTDMMKDKDHEKNVLHKATTTKINALMFVPFVA